VAAAWPGQPAGHTAPLRPPGTMLRASPAGVARSAVASGAAPPPQPDRSSRRRSRRGDLSLMVTSQGHHAARGPSAVSTDIDLLPGGNRTRRAGAADERTARSSGRGYFGATANGTWSRCRVRRAPQGPQAGSLAGHGADPDTEAGCLLRGEHDEQAVLVDSLGDERAALAAQVGQGYFRRGDLPPSQRIEILDMIFPRPEMTMPQGAVLPEAVPGLARRTAPHSP